MSCFKGDKGKLFSLWLDICSNYILYNSKQLRDFKLRGPTTTTIKTWKPYSGKLWGRATLAERYQTKEPGFDSKPRQLFKIEQRLRLKGGCVTKKMPIPTECRLLVKLN